MRYVDANIILRYILDDHEELSPAAKAIVGAGDIFVPTEVLAEVVYVLARVYGVSREEVQESVSAFIADSGCGLAGSEAIAKALELYGVTSLDFVDCALVAYSAVEGVKVESFDK